MKAQVWCHHLIRFIEYNGEWWAILADIQDALGLSNIWSSISNVKTVNISNMDIKIINEFGIYDAILQSYKPEAKTFREKLYLRLQENRQLNEIVTFELLNILNEENQDNIIPSQKQKKEEKEEEFFKEEEKLYILDNTPDENNSNLPIEYLSAIESVKWWLSSPVTREFLYEYLIDDEKFSKEATEFAMKFVDFKKMALDIANQEQKDYHKSPEKIRQEVLLEYWEFTEDEANWAIKHMDKF